jgi:hypothetical protein
MARVIRSRFCTCEKPRRLSPANRLFKAMNRPKIAA